MSRAATLSKGVLFTIGVSAISAAVALIQTDLQTGIALFLVGLILVVLCVFLIEWQAKEGAVKEAIERMRFELEHKRRDKSD